MVKGPEGYESRVLVQNSRPEMLLTITAVPDANNPWPLSKVCLVFVALEPFPSIGLQ